MVETGDPGSSASDAPELGRARARQREAGTRRGGQAMMRLRRASVTASVECAWVPWLESQMFG